MFTKQFLTEEYISKGKSAIQIAKEQSCGTATVYRDLKKQGVQTRYKLPKNKCADCNKTLSNTRAKRCLSCNMVLSWKTNPKIRISRTGKNNNLYGHLPTNSRWYVYKGIKMRSSWEVKYAEYCDKHNISWVYEYTTFEIKVKNYKNTFTPDFYILKEKKFIEIKGYWYEKSKIKFNAFKQQYPHINIEVLDKKKLKQLGIKI